MRAQTPHISHAAVIALALAGPLTAQTPVPMPVVPGRLIETAEAPPEVRARLEEMRARGGQQPGGGGDAAAQTANKRLQAFRKLQFDRRPSRILEAWAAPELKPYDPSEDAKPGDATSGAPAAGAAVPPAGERRPQVPVDVASTGALSPEQIQALIDSSEAAPPAGPTAPGTSGAGAKGPSAGAPAKGNAAQVEQKRLQREMEMLQRDVTLSRWHKVGAFLSGLPEEQQKGAYEHLLKVLPRHPNKPPQRVPQNLQEKNRFAFEEVFVLAGLAPGGFDKKQAKLLAPIVRRAIDDGSVLEELVRLLGVEVSKPEAQQRIDRREAAMLLSELKQDVELGVFLPTAAAAEADNDREALNLLARHALAMYAKEKRRDWLQVAWQVTQSALAKGDVSDEDKKEALRRAVELAPKVRDDLGPAWLADSFTKRPERGMEIVATIGGQVATGFQKKARDASYRAAGLQLQKTAVEALLDVAPELAERWRETLGLLASGWIVEASYSRKFSKTTSYGPMMERDAFGNIFWTDRRRGGGGNVTAIEPADLMKAQPSDRWAALLGDELRPHFQTVSAQLWLKVNEHQKAFPYIEQLAATNARKAKELAHEFLRVWMRNNNPNVNNRTNSYMFIYGFDQRSNGIPLTRSKQQRNLEDLAGYVARLRELPIGGVDDSLLGEAFVAAHSAAEVYRIETIEKVFGEVEDMSPMLLSNLLGRMRTNLATIWRVPAVQEQQKTRRSQKEMLAEVERGYDTALTIAQNAYENSGQHWSLQVAVAAILHDRNNFAKEQKRDSGFSDNRMAAFDQFADAADSYAAVADGLALDEENTTPFSLWFYAVLGACDLGAIDEESVVAKSQLPLIKQALAALPDGSRERHEAMFANQLFTRMSACKPDIKFRYLQAGFEIVGDHEQAAEARKVWDYYRDLVRELKIETVVDGDTAVGTEPFGVRIDIVHTGEIERESGGFQKYATNQNNQQYAYNYGRPTENYRDKFHDAAINALREHFEILSVTFNSEKMESARDAAPGWRRTSYAYMLLQARGPQVDRIPTLQMDFDFNDTTGFFVMPVGSAPVAIDASTTADSRPFADIEVNQLLDERRIDEGKITLEIKAKSKGLVPDLDAFLDLDTPGFVVTKSDDQGAAVVRFADDQERIESERVWLLQMKPEESGSLPSFRFAEPNRDGVTAVYQRYDDADLETVSAVVALRTGPPGSDPIWAWVLVALAFVGYLVWFFFAPERRSVVVDEDDVLRMPQQLTPFAVLALLQKIASRNELIEEHRQQLEGDMRRIEACHFGRGSDDQLDLGEIADQWLRRAS